MACRLVLTQGMKQALAAWKVGEEPVGAKRNKRACAEAGRAGAVPPAHASLKLDEFCPHPNAGTFASHLTPLLPQLGTPGTEGKGYCLLPGFGDHKVLHHLPLQGQGLQGKEKIRLISLPPPTQTLPGTCSPGMSSAWPGWGPDGPSVPRRRPSASDSAERPPLEVSAPWK